MFQTLWLVLTYSYNAILVLFIATHLFVGAIISFLTGLYSGVYLSQNYDIPRITEPRAVWDKFLTFLEKNRRNPQKISMTNILRPTTIKEMVLEEQSPSSTETILVPKRNVTTTFTQAGSQTSQDFEEGIITEPTTSEVAEGDKSETTDTSTTLTPDSTSNPLTDNGKTLILTEPEDFVEESRNISSEQILEASLTLDKNKAISRSASKLNEASK